MTKYIPKHIPLIEAMQWDGTQETYDKILALDAVVSIKGSPGDAIVVATPVQMLYLNVGDWLTIQAEPDRKSTFTTYWTISKDDFEATYERM